LMIDASETSDGIVPRRKRELRFVHLVGRCGACAAGRGLPRQVASAHQEAIDRMRGLSALANGPYHQTLTAAHVAGREHLWPRLDAGVTVVGVEPLEASARHHGEAEVFYEVALHRPGETHREQHELGRQLALAPRHRLQRFVDTRIEELFHLAIT